MAMTEVGTRAVVIEQEVEIAAPPARVYQAALRETGSWFYVPTEESAHGRSAIEPFVGGRFWRDYGEEGGELYGHVTRLDRDALVRIAGTFGNRFASTSVVDLAIEAKGGGSVVRLSHRVSGDVPEELASEFERGWECELANLRSFVETGRVGS